MTSSRRFSLTGFLIEYTVSGNTSHFLSSLSIMLFLLRIELSTNFFREAAIKCIKSLIEQLGSQWAEKQLFPKIIPFQSNPYYLHRMTLLFIIQVKNIV